MFLHLPLEKRWPKVTVSEISCKSTPKGNGSSAATPFGVDLHLFFAATY